MGNKIDVAIMNREPKDAPGVQATVDSLLQRSKYLSLKIHFSSDLDPLPMVGANIASMRMEGDYFLVIPQDHILMDDLHHATEFIDSLEFADRTVKIATLQSGSTCWVTGDPKVPRFVCPRFPIVTRDSISALGGSLFHPKFAYSWAPNWLGYVLGMRGEEVHEAPVRLKCDVWLAHQEQPSIAERDPFYFDDLYTQWKPDDKYLFEAKWTDFATPKHDQSGATEPRTAPETGGYVEQCLRSS